MVRHIVMWRLKDEAEGKSKTENVQIIKHSLEALYGIAPTLKSITVAPNMEGVPESNFDLVLVCTFDDLAGLDAYQNHEAHQKALSYIRRVVSERVCVDYEE